MKQSNGIIRKLDLLGRVTLPIDMRRQLYLGERADVEMVMEGDNIVLKKATASDVFTGSTDELVEYKGKWISKESIAEIAALLDK